MQSIEKVGVEGLNLYFGRKNLEGRGLNFGGTTTAATTTTTTTTTLSSSTSSTTSTSTTSVNNVVFENYQC